MAVVLNCCGTPMTYRKVFGICVFSCVHRHHARLYVKGDQVISEDDLPAHAQETIADVDG
jgi:hypothetical protein